MDGLDLLKKHWNKDQDFPKVNGDEIHTMLRKSSSSIVKWIFIICCLELIIGLSLSFSIPVEKEKFFAFAVLGYVYDLVFYVVVLYFMFKFFINLRKINNTQNTKSLMESILDVRKNADRYIQFNLWCIYLTILITFVHVLVDEIYLKYHDDAVKDWSYIILLIFIFTALFSLFAVVLVLVIKFYYRMVYGFFLKKLNNNYEELTKLERY
ncbi:hypothetical protein ACL9RF_09200 [Sphingobacterium sp. Mn56C]|uniref:hypothetical protein n=1 Tax=Sphingobacterium sp. Mn56C TaxID=3395261 RepID=UPI003BDCE0DF